MNRIDFFLYSSQRIKASNRVSSLQVEFGGEKVSNDWDTESEVSEKIDNNKMTSTEKKIVVEKELSKKVEAEPPELQSNGSTPINSPIQERQVSTLLTVDSFIIYKISSLFFLSFAHISTCNDVLP